MMPLTIGESTAFKEMMHAANRSIQVPSYKTTTDTLYKKKYEISLKLKAYIVGTYFSTTIDHWTSVANEIYGKITCHLIDDNFKLRAHVLSCKKHENGCSAREMEQQLISDLNSWNLFKGFYVL